MGYRVSGNKILDNGVEIQLHGTNFIGMEWANVVDGLYAGGTSIPKFLDTFKSWGFNTLRLPVAPATLRKTRVEPNATGTDWKSESAPLKDKNSIEILDYLVDELEKRGLRYYFDHHYLEFDRNPKIPHLWWTDRYSEAEWLEDLAFMALRYKGKKGFVGIDIKNEPNKNGATYGTGDVKTDWKIAVEKAFKVMNAVNTDILIIVEGLEFNLDIFLTKPLNIPREYLVLSTHAYFESVWGPYVTNFRDQNFDLNAYWDKAFGNVARDYPVLIGEWGGFYEGVDKRAQDKFVDYLKMRNIPHHSYWCHTPNSGDTGGLFADGGFEKVREDKLANINRLKSPLATFTTDAPKPNVKPEPKPSVEGVTPMGSFKAGDIVQLKSGGPSYTVSFSAPVTTTITYYSQVLGKIISEDVPTSALKPGVAMKAKKPESAE